jgi:hypothetical protein
MELVSYSSHLFYCHQYCDISDKKTAVYKFIQIITDHCLTISVQATKLMALKGGDPVRSKIVIANKVIVEVNSFNYIRNLISFEK